VVRVENYIKEQLSEAYVRAVVGRAGCCLSMPVKDFGVDGTICSLDIRGSKIRQSPYSVDYQLKSTVNWQLVDNNHIAYDLKSKNYNDLVGRSADDPSMILILFCLPDDTGSWLQVSSSSLVIQECCYWVRLDGGKIREDTTKRIHVPKNNILNVETVKMLLSEEKSRRQECFS